MNVVRSALANSKLLVNCAGERQRISWAILDRADASITDYIFNEPAKCSRCRQPLVEKTPPRMGQGKLDCDDEDTVIDAVEEVGISLQRESCSFAIISCVLQ